MNNESTKKDQKSEVVQQREYVKPEIRVMSEREILNQFQITQSMVGWWTTGAC